MKSSELRGMRREAKRQLNKETQELIAEVDADRRDYYQLKKWRWWQVILSTIFIILGVGFAFLVGYLTYNQPKTPGWQGVAWFAASYSTVGGLAWLILGFIKNQRSMRFFSDRRQRYRHTFQADEARIQVARRIILLALIPYLAFTITVAIIF